MNFYTLHYSTSSFLINIGWLLLWQTSPAIRPIQCSSTFTSKNYCWKSVFMYDFVQLEHFSLWCSNKAGSFVAFMSLANLLKIQHLFSQLTFEKSANIFLLINPVFLIFILLTFSQIFLTFLKSVVFLVLILPKFSVSLVTVLWSLFSISQYTTSSSHHLIILQYPVYFRGYIFLLIYGKLYISVVAYLRMIMSMSPFP